MTKHAQWAASAKGQQTRGCYLDFINIHHHHHQRSFFNSISLSRDHSSNQDDHLYQPPWHTLLLCPCSLALILPCNLTSHSSTPKRSSDFVKINLLQTPLPGGKEKRHPNLFLPRMRMRDSTWVASSLAPEHEQVRVTPVTCQVTQEQQWNFIPCYNEVLSSLSSAYIFTDN